MLKDGDKDILLFRSKFLKQKDYWLKKLSGDFDTTGILPGFEKKGPGKKGPGKIDILLPDELGRRVVTLCKGAGLSLYIFLLSALKLLLFRYTSNGDVVVLSPIYKGHATEETINTLLFIRDYVDAGMTFKELLLEVRQSVLQAYENQDYPFDRLVEYLGARAISDILCSLDTLHDDRNIENIGAALSFRFSMRGDRVGGYLSYDGGAGAEGAAVRLSNHFVRLLAGIADNVNIGISGISFLTEQERKQLLEDFNNNRGDYCTNRTVDGFVKVYAEKTPDAVALVFGDSGITYRHLNNRVAVFSGHLRARGLRAHQTVGILSDRSPAMVESILAVWRAGAAYIPLDPGYPNQRVLEILGDSRSGILIAAPARVDGHLKAACPASIITPGEQKGRGEPGPGTGTGRLAYVIYTSGSTGKPKGAMVEHTGMMNHMAAKVRDLQLTGGSIVAQNASHTFDISVWQFFTALILGGRTVIYPDELVFEPARFIARLIDHRVSILEVVPSYLSVMLEFPGLNEGRLQSLRYLLVTGETIKPGLVERWFDQYPGLKMVNAYGPTEASDDITHFVMDKAPGGGSVPIGKPIQNFAIYIVDKNLNLCPVGVGGEICTAGAGVGRGYLNNPQLTAERFIWNPYAPSMTGCRRAAARLYKTGDMGRWLTDGGGVIEFLGRKDYQVKIRGFRIELGEIESRLSAHPAVGEAAAMVKGDADKILCAFLVAREQLAVPAIREYLAERLPAYMVPDQFVLLQRMPLTANGKLDRKALARMDTGIAVRKEYAAPRDHLEKKLVEIWSRLLKKEKETIGIDANFFEIGGHSLNATIMTAKIHRALDVRLPLAKVFEYPDIRSLAREIRASRQERFLSIAPVEKKGYYILSSAQKRLYLLQQMDPESTAYNLPRIIPLPDEEDTGKLEKIFIQLIERHESLRTSFHMTGKEPVQVVHGRGDIGFEIRNYEVKNSDEIEEIRAHVIGPFDLARAPLLRAGFVKIGPSRRILFIDMHHIITDGTSQDVLEKEFNTLYRGEELPPLRLQYKDFAQWQNSKRQREALRQQEEYWLKQFAGEIPVLDLPVDYPRPAVQSFEGNSMDFRLSDRQAKALTRLAETGGATLYMVVLAVTFVFLSKITGQEDIIIGTPAAARRHADMERIIGMFVSTLALENYPSGDKTFKEFLNELKERTLGAFENQEYPFEDLVDKVSVPRDIGRNPLFDVMFSFESIHVERDGGEPGADAPADENQDVLRAAKFDLMLFVIEAGEKLFFKFQYCSKLFKRETIRRFTGYFRRIVSAVTGDADCRLPGIEIISGEEKKHILYDFNNTETAFPEEKTIHRLFERRAEKSPHRTAAAGPGFISYRELNKRSDGLAFLLRDKGLPAESIIGIMSGRSMEMIIGILGILKSGAAYLPIEPHYPAERINFMLADSSAGILLTAPGLADEISCEGEILVLPEAINRGSRPAPSTAPTPAAGGRLCYEIYTSGSTGKPKGVAVEHHSVVNILFSLQRIYPLDMKDSYLFKTPYVFDVSVTELFGWILGGGRLMVLEPGGEKDPRSIIAAIEKHSVTHINFVPSMFGVFTAYLKEEGITGFPGLKYIFLAGEALSPVMVREFQRTAVESKAVLENIYGPTEGAIYTTRYPLASWDGGGNIPIGQPLDNIKVYVIDRYNGLQPVGLAGELCLSGTGLARGYLNRPELTAAAFVENPRLTGGLMYRTGDLAQWLPDGNIQFLGRIDGQVKIRGNRVELGEIEGRLLEHEGIKEAVVPAVDREGTPTLCAYIVPAGDSGEPARPLSAVALIEYLSRSLPDYMIPSYFMRLTEIPLTPGGKVDRGALPAPGTGGLETGEEYTAPQNRLERKLAEIWGGVLGIEKDAVSTGGNFFRLGGHSLKAAVLLAKIHREFNIKLPLAAVFKKPTIKGLAAYMQDRAEDRFAAVWAAEKREYYPLSPAQKRLYILQRMNPENTVYNMPQAVQLGIEIEKDRLRRVFQWLTRRHESLRTSFHTVNEEAVQRIHDHTEFELEYLEPGSSEEETMTIIKAFIRPFDLTRAPLMKAGLLEFAGGRRLLVVDMHHVVSDGISHDILVNDFMSLYENGMDALSGLRIQYKDFSQWQSSGKVKQDTAHQEAYWLGHFQGEIPVLDLPLDYPRARVRSFEGNSVDFQVPLYYNSKSLKRIALEQNATLYMVMLAVFNVLLAKLSGQEDIIVGTAVAGRRHADLEKIIGMFVNILCLRNYPESGISFSEFLKDLRERTLEAFENQEYQFEDLVDRVAVNRSTARNPLFDVMFTLQAMDAGPGAGGPGDVPAEGAAAAATDSRRDGRGNIMGISKFDITLAGVETPTGLYFTLEYCTKLFKEETVRRFTDCFKNVTSAILTNPEVKISRVEIIPEEEKRRIILDFNDTERAYPKDKTVRQLFEEQVERRPDRIAVVYKDHQLTYSRLNQQAGRLAGVLRSRGCGTAGNNIVGIMVDHSLEMMIGIPGILKSGAPYLPIEAKLPGDRIISMLDDCRVTVLLTKRSILTDRAFGALQGLRRHGAPLVVTGTRPQIRDLDNLPIPDRSLVDYEKYGRHIGLTMFKHTLALQASRGCPYNCAYCHKIWPKGHVVRSPRHIFAEVKLYYDMGVRRFAFIDDIFNLDRENSMRFFQLVIRHKLKAQFFFPNGFRGDILTKDYIDLAIEAGTVNIALSLETASPRLQKLVRKHINIEKLGENIRYICDKYPGVILELQTMHGFPTETEEEAMMTLDFMKSIRWIDFPYVHILKIYPNTDLEKLAIENGVSAGDIEKSAGLAYHELPGTLPFDKDFTLKYQTGFLNEYFISRERLLSVLPHQIKLLTEDELVQKYNSYLPVRIEGLSDVLEFAGIAERELAAGDFPREEVFAVPGLNGKMRERFPARQARKDALRVMLLDLSQFFGAAGEMLYNVVEAPLGPMYLATYLKQIYGSRISAKIAKSGMDFDNYTELKALLEEFKPGVIGIRSLTFYKDFFHQTVSLIRQWGFDVPVIAGGPYATSDYTSILQDRGVDLVVLGEGEATFSEIIGKILENNGRMPDEKVLEKIPSVAFVPGKKGAASTFAREIIMLDELLLSAPGEPAGGPGAIDKPGDLAYVVYTSGSTGKPRGVMIRHRSLNNLCHWHNRVYSVTPSDRATKYAGFGFDASVWEIFPYLVVGASIDVIDDGIKLDMQRLNDYFERRHITIAFLPTQICEQFMHLENRSLRILLTGGDKLKDYVRGNYRLANNYGPSENTVVATGCFIGKEYVNIPIGRPIDNVKVYILDKQDHLAMPGVGGELCVGGDSLSAGYLNHPQLTREKFTMYRPVQDKAPLLLYRTGDMTRWLPDGNIEFLGRVDHQVKVRGHRIEPGEIERRLLTHKGIEEVVVLAREDEGGEKYLCAYIVGKTGSPGPIDPPQLKKFLSHSLPGYMIPAYFIELEKIPLTANGKIDRRALPVPVVKGEDGYTAPGSEREKKLAAIWAEVLRIEKGIIGVDTDFFRLGGDSLKATVLIARIHKGLNVKIPVVEFFKAPTIRGLAGYIKKVGRDEFVSVKPVEKKEYYPLSSAQKRLYVQQQVDLKSTRYNIPRVMELEGAVEKKKLENVFIKLIQRHESLRTAFVRAAEQPVQKVCERHKLEFRIEYWEKGAVKRLSVDGLVNGFMGPFDLSRAPLLRVGLINVEEKRHVLMTDMHHIISDGVSNGILVREFMALHKGEELPFLKLHYKDFSQWQNSVTPGGEIKKQEEYWLKVFAEKTPVLKMPYDHPRPDHWSFEGDYVSFELGTETTAALKELALRDGATLYMVLLAIYNVLIAKLSGQEDIVVGTAVAGRRHADLEPIIGMFLNMLAIRNYPRGQKTFKAFFGEVIDTTLAAYANQDYQFENLVERAVENREVNRHPLFDVGFDLQNTAAPAERAQQEPGLKLKSYNYENKTAKIDMNMLGTESGKNIFFTIEYNTALFEEETIQRFSAYYKKIAASVIENPGKKIKEIDILEEEEINRMFSNKESDESAIHMDFDI